jgi:hypothetical protein
MEDSEIVMDAVIEVMWRWAAGGCGKIRWVGFSLFYVEFGFHFKAPFRVMIAFAKNLIAQKKTETDFSRPAVLGLGESFYWLLAYQESSFCYPHY